MWMHDEWGSGWSFIGPTETPNTRLLELAIISDEISLDLEESIHHGKAFGFHKYEIRCLDDYEHRIPYFRPGHMERLEELVADGSMEITALTPGTFKIDLSDSTSLRRELEETLPRTCEMALRLKAPRIITFGFMREEGIEEAAVVEALLKAADIIGSFGLEMPVENEPGSYCDTGVNTARIIKAIGQSHVGINWDPANAVVAGEAAYPVGYAAVLPYIQNIHLKDAVPIPPDKWENRLLGDGDVDWPGQMRAFLKDKPVGHLTLETHVFPLLESTREDLRRLKQLMDDAREHAKDPA
jgi:sugar phosphate isomerase/epimerase